MSNHLQLRNAAARAAWTLKFFSGSTCADPLGEIARAYADLSLERKRHRAQRWLEAGKKFKRAQAIAAAGNVVPLPSLLRRQAE